MQIQPLSAALGAELVDIDLRSLHADQTVELRQALLDYKVVGIRDQHLDDAEHVALARALGQPWIHPMDRLAGVTQAAPSELRVTSDHQLQTDTWHLDVMYAPTPPAFGILRGVQIPPVGGDTMWTNLTLAAAALDEELRAQLVGRHTVHSVPNILLEIRGSIYKDFDPQVWVQELSNVKQPMLRRHPETDETAMFAVGQDQVDGLDAEGSAALMAQVTAHATNLNFTCRWRWQNGDVIIWDERCTAHYAIRDPWEGERVLRRLLVEGDTPVAAAQ